MKIEKIKFNGHKFFNNLDIDFKGSNEEILNTIVIIGENGTGKTTLLKSIFEAFDIFSKNYNEISNDKVELTSNLYTITVKLGANECGMLYPDRGLSKIDYDENHPKVVYMPTEINFDKANKVDNTFNFKPDFRNVIDQNMTQNIPSFIATKINKEIFKNRNKTIAYNRER